MFRCLFSSFIRKFVDIFQLNQDIQVRSNEVQRESRKKDKLERELKQSRAELDTKSSEIKTMQTSIDRYKQDITKLETQLKEQRVSIYIILIFFLALCSLLNIYIHNPK